MEVVLLPHTRVLLTRPIPSHTHYLHPTPRLPAEAKGGIRVGNWLQPSPCPRDTVLPHTMKALFKRRSKTPKAGAAKSPASKGSGGTPKHEALTRKSSAAIQRPDSDDEIECMYAQVLDALAIPAAKRGEMIANESIDRKWMLIEANSSMLKIQRKLVRRESTAPEYVCVCGVCGSCGSCAGVVWVGVRGWRWSGVWECGLGADNVRVHAEE